MIKIVILQSLLIFIYMASKSNNPLKTSLMIMLFSLLSFLCAKMVMGNTWFPIIMFMLFAGGILMTFMILSCVMPNEKVKKSKMLKTLAILSGLTTLMSNVINLPSKENMGEVKSTLSSLNMFTIMMSLILMYFFYSIGLNESEDNPMRSI